MIIRVNQIERLVQQAMCKLDGARKKYHSGTIRSGVTKALKQPIYPSLVIDH
jgi:hypothetical protein